MQFNKDGSLAVAKVTITKETEYLWVLKAIQDIPFPVGKKLLSDFIRGDESNSSIIGCKLDTKTCFGCLAYTESEIDALIGKLLLAGCVALVPSKKNKYWKVLEITKKGFEELQNPTLNQPKNELPKETATISDAEKKVFIAFDHILSQYNDLQKKAIITNTEKILCIAGAGSGKTTVLTKRIEFLIRYKSVDPKKILAITFTRKARQEMKSRLQNAGIDSVQIHTFNSFCEQLLQRHASLLYDKPMRVIT
ncbi:MAG: UvrD-helicase domain-containing protein [Candidatus Woesearchaeota archaeon]